MTKVLLTVAAFLVFYVYPPQTLGQAAGGGRSSSIAAEAAGLAKTWKGPSVAVISRIFQKRSQTATAKPTTVQNLSSIKFRPVADSGVAQSLADLFGTTPAEKTAMRQLFTQVKTSYESEAAKEGKSNDLAAAMTFFLGANVMVYHQTEVPSDEVSEKLYNSIRDVMLTLPEIGRMTNAEKQQTHDWLVYMGGWAAVGYMDAKQKGDAESIKNYRDIAKYATQIVLGVDIEQLSLS